MTRNEAVSHIRKTLQEAGLYTENDLNTLFETATGMKIYDLSSSTLSSEQESKIDELLKKRISGIPLQYIARYWPFLDFEVKVDERALIPRPETEQLAEKVKELFGNEAYSNCLDLCSGTGVLAFCLKRFFPSSSVSAVELSHEACSLMEENKSELQLDIRVIEMDAADYLNSCPDCSFDIITCNPPYITPKDYSDNYDELKLEPKMAFIGGEDGLFFYRELIPIIKEKLKCGHPVAFEIGNDQADPVLTLLNENGFSNASVFRDYNNLDRIAVAYA